MSQQTKLPLRGNRSFVIREGRFTEGQKKAFEQLWPTLGIDAHHIDQLNPNDYFKNSQPTVLDVGFGSGDSLVSLAQQRSDINFIGVEVYRPGIGTVLGKINQLELQNVRLMNIDVMQLLTTMVPDNIFAGVMVWFPDPWPKSKHHKRRLVQHVFLLELVRVMQPNSILHLASDWQPYVEFMIEHVSQVKAFTPIEISSNPLNLTRPTTRFEQRGIRRGHTVSDLIYQLNK